MFNLSGRVAVVTGGSSGLGVQFAHALGRQGADVVVIARRVEMLKDVAASITEKYGVRTGYYYCDVTDSRQVAEVSEKIVADFGKIDIAVNCAGGGNCGNTEDLPDEKWHKTMDVNINGVFYCCREFGKAMIKNGYGRIFSRQAFIDSIINNHLNTICETAISNTKITVIAIQGFQNIQLHSRNTDVFSGLYICKFKNIFAVAHGNRIPYYTGVP